MKNYMDLWFGLMCVALIMIPIYGRNTSRKVVFSLVGTFCCAMWTLNNPSYYDVEVLGVILVVGLALNLFCHPKNKYSMKESILIILLLVSLFFYIFFGFGQWHKSWYLKNFCEVQLVYDPDVDLYVIPKETERVRFDYGFNFYQATICQKQVDGPYTIQFFYYEENGRYGEGTFYSLNEDYANEVVVLPKDPSELDYVYRYRYSMRYIDQNTGEPLDNGRYIKYEFHLSKEVAEEINKRLK